MATLLLTSRAGSGAGKARPEVHLNIITPRHKINGRRDKIKKRTSFFINKKHCIILQRTCSLCHPIKEGVLGFQCFCHMWNVCVTSSNTLKVVCRGTEIRHAPVHCRCGSTSPICRKVGVKLEMCNLINIKSLQKNWESCKKNAILFQKCLDRWSMWRTGCSRTVKGEVVPSSPSLISRREVNCCSGPPMHTHPGPSNFDIRVHLRLEEGWLVRKCVCL